MVGFSLVIVWLLIRARTGNQASPHYSSRELESQWLWKCQLGLLLLQATTPLSNNPWMGWGKQEKKKSKTENKYTNGLRSHSSSIRSQEEIIQVHFPFFSSQAPPSLWPWHWTRPGWNGLRETASLVMQGSKSDETSFKWGNLVNKWHLSRHQKADTHGNNLLEHILSTHGWGTFCGRHQLGQAATWT